MSTTSSWTFGLLWARNSPLEVGPPFLTCRRANGQVLCDGGAGEMDWVWFHQRSGRGHLRTCVAASCVAGTEQGLCARNESCGQAVRAPGVIRRRKGVVRIGRRVGPVRCECVFFFGVWGEGDILNRATVLLREVPWSPPPPKRQDASRSSFFPLKVLADVRSADLVPLPLLDAVRGFLHTKNECLALSLSVDLGQVTLLRPNLVLLR
ncbi:hypothetical protein B7P43_G17745 [Cryptotermes secundus]|uniref:Uncharacterized protein n=1 Tax=Cryptotermes secundus TaxID=105785 RepID=A0A2J7RQN5_9NEOP|nr:hypothetical protein B7P43_G17745 [Cryptotermes secundus]